jgi:uncharacterized protein (UPF0218 family)
MAEGPARLAFDPGAPIPNDIRLVLPEALRERLGSPFGPVFPPEELNERTKGAPAVAAVGDVTAGEAIARGIPMRFIVVDFKTRRGPVALTDTLRAFGDTVERVRSPPSVLTSMLWNAVRRAAKSKRRTRIEVEGEEDLAVLPSIMHLELGAIVIYGLPDRGVASVIVGENSRKLAREFLESFVVERV